MLTERQEQDIWAAIRAGISMCHEDMRKAVEAKTYSMASAHEDEIARKLAARVIDRLSPTETKETP